MRRPFKDSRPVGPIFSSSPYGQGPVGVPELIVTVTLPDSVNTTQGRNQDLERTPSVERVEINPDGDVEATLRHKKGTAADIRGKGIYLIAIKSLVQLIEKEYGVDIDENYDVKMFSVTQRRVKV